jgi:uncharacterized membrane protein
LRCHHAIGRQAGAVIMLPNLAFGVDRSIANRNVMNDSSVGVGMRGPMLRLLALGFVAALGFGLSSTAALADLKLCNKTDSRVGVALGYKDKEGWASEGWWNIGPNNCETLLKGPLIARYYYIFAVDYDKGGSWGGKSMMCTRDKIFTIRGITDCESRGYQKTGFFEVDTGEETDWTISLSGEKTSTGAQTQ